MVSTVIGEEIKINNGKNMKGSINIEGNTYQEVEDGKNKAIIPDKEENFHSMAINIKNGVITITGTSDVTYTSYKVVGTAKLEAGKKYYLRLWGSKSGSATLFKDSENQWFPDSENQEYEFTPTVGGTYNIQLGFGGGENQNWNARYSISETSNSDWVEGKEATPTLVNPSVVQAVGDSGSVEIVKSNKNLLDFGYDSVAGITFNKNKVTIKNPNSYNYVENFNLKANKVLSGKKVAFTYVINGEVTGDNYVDLIFNSNKRSYIVQKQANKSHGTYTNEIFTKAITFANDEYLTGCVVWTAGTTCDLTIYVQIEISDEASDFIEHEGNTYTIPIQKPFYKLGDYKDKFVKQDGKWYEQHNIKEYIFTGNENWFDGGTTTNNQYIWSNPFEDANKSILGNYNDDIVSPVLSNYFISIGNRPNNAGSVGISFVNFTNGETHLRVGVGLNSEYNTLELFKQKLQELNAAGTPVKMYYILATPELIECTSEQTQILEQLSNLYLYEGINYLYSTDDLSPIFQFSYDKIVNDFKFYLSENGRLIFPNENISFLCSISESSIPSMPEALETSATIAGRDGDVPLSTTYGPMSFELVLYTEDNLTPEEKLKQEIFLNRFCNLIKNNTETFALELAQKFYKIKYNGVLSKENFPKFLRFTLPFKSSKSFAYDVKKHIIYGNSTVESNTIEPTGFECVIKGPAIKPIISLNDYSIEYNNTILDDESLIIDTNNSTAVLVNSEGTRVNAMRYYNHQFPKILNGENELKILSGIDNPENVSISWYDLTL